MFNFFRKSFDYWLLMDCGFFCIYEKFNARSIAFVRIVSNEAAPQKKKDI